MRRIIKLTLAILLIFAGSMSAVPAPKEGSAKEATDATDAKVAPHMRLGETSWGTMTRNGLFLDWTGHPEWTGAGEILPEHGVVRIIWTFLATGEPCPGVYRLDRNGLLVGQWGTLEMSRIEPNWTLSGQVYDDVANDRLDPTDVMNDPPPPVPCD